MVEGQQQGRAGSHTDRAEALERVETGVETHRRHGSGSHAGAAALSEDLARTHGGGGCSPLASSAELVAARRRQPAQDLQIRPAVSDERRTPWSALRRAPGAPRAAAP